MPPSQLGCHKLTHIGASLVQGDLVRVGANAERKKRTSPSLTMDQIGENPPGKRPHKQDHPYEAYHPGSSI